MSRFAKIEGIIADWEEEFPNGIYAYRGQSKIYPSSTSAAYRRVPSSLLRILPDNKKGGDMQELEARLLSCELLRFPPHTSFFEARTEARHLGYPTGCIDFSNNILVALFFACRRHDKKHGELLFLKIADMPFAHVLGQDLLAAPALPRSDTVIVATSHTEHTEYHNRLQSSVLVLPQKGYLDFAESHTRKVLAGNKELFKDYLDENFISQRTLFGGPYRAAGAAKPKIQRRISTDFPQSCEDIERLLRRRDSLAHSSDLYERGKEYYHRGEYAKALEYFHETAKQAKLSRSNREFHQFLTSTYLHLCQYQRALRQLKQLPQSNWSDVDYYMAAEGNLYLGHIEAALSNMQEAIKRNSRRPIYHRALVSIAVRAGDYDLAEDAARANYYSSQDDWDLVRLLDEIDCQRKKVK